MASNNFSPMKTGLSRIFVVEGAASAGRVPEYKGSLVLGSVSQDLGDVEEILAPSPDKYEEFDEVGETTAPASRVESSLSGRFPVNARFDLITWARKRCNLVIHAHFGQCTNPKSFNDFQKAVIFEKARLTNLDIDEIGSLEESTTVDGSADYSAPKDMWYEVAPLVFSQRANDLATNEVLGVSVHGDELCDDCGDELILLAVTADAGGSPSTPADVLFSLDKGVTWYAHDVDSASNDCEDVGVVGDYVVATSNGDAGIHIGLLSEHKVGSDPTYTQVTTGFASGGEPNAIWSTGFKGFIVGDNGYAYATEDPTAGVSILDAGVAVSDNLLDVHALSSEFVVACGQNGAVIYTTDGESFDVVTTRPTGAGVHLNCIWAKNELEWWVGTNGGQLFYTLDGGESWTARTFSGHSSGAIHDIVFPTPSVGYVSHATSAPRGRVLQTVGGGAANTWFVIPRNSTITANDRINSLAAVDGEPNLLLGGGLADDGSDGFLIVGKS